MAAPALVRCSETISQSSARLAGMLRCAIESAHCLNSDATSRW